MLNWTPENKEIPKILSAMFRRYKNISSTMSDFCTFSVKPEHYLYTMDFLDAVDETFQKILSSN